jgi:hypothetical protein
MVAIYASLMAFESNFPSSPSMFLKTHLLATCGNVYLDGIDSGIDHNLIFGTLI